jgi:hypothetical protein
MYPLVGQLGKSLAEKIRLAVLESWKIDHRLLSTRLRGFAAFLKVAAPN